MQENSHKNEHENSLSKDKDIICRYEKLLDHLPDLIININKKLILTQVNRTDVKIFNFTSSDIINKRITAIFPATYHNELKEKIKKVFEQQTTENVIFSQLKDNTPFTFELRIIPFIENEVIGVIRDVSEAKENRIRNKILSNAVENSPVSIVITDANGTIEYINPVFTQVTGYSFEEATGKNPRILKSGYQDADFYKEMWETISSGKPWKGEFYNRKKNGELYWELTSISSVKNENGEIIRYISMREDITKRKETVEQLVKAKQQAEESDKLKSAFLSNMSHEIRTPMNSIIGFTELLKTPGLATKKRKRFLDIIESNSKMLLNLLNDIISVSKMQSGEIIVKTEKAKVYVILTELYSVYNDMRTTNDKNEIDFDIEVAEEDKEIVIHSDPYKIRQIIRNLLDNAFKFTKKGSIKFGYHINNDLIFFVKDTGIGIPVEYHNKIFESFWQVESSTQRSYGGTGLGLSIAKNLTTMLGGEIWLESTPGKGSIFYFSIPYQPGKIGPNLLLQNNKKRAKKWKGKTILIAEDEESNYILLEEALENTKINIIHAENGKEAIREVKMNPMIDLVLMDIKMPDLDGFEATKQIKMIYPELPVIVQTAYALPDQEAKIRQAGCDDYITKPIDTSNLIKTLEKYL